MISLKELLGEKNYFAYLHKIIAPSIEKYAKSGNITPQELEKIWVLIEEKGYSAIEPRVDFLDHLTLNTSETEGYIAQAEISLTENVTLKNIIKRSSYREDFNAAVQNQVSTYQQIVGTEFEGKVPYPDFVNHADRIMVTPFIQGDILKNVLFEKDSNEKERILTDVIDDYISFIKYLNNPDTRSKLKFPESIKTFDDFFLNFYLDDDLESNPELIENYKSQISDELNSSRNKVIHGDPHGKNIILNGQIVYLDWPNAASNGFFEFDLAKLLTKSDIGFDLEEKLVKQASEKLYDSVDEQESSFRRYTKTQINFELLASKKYLGRASNTKDKAIKQRLENMSIVLYNDALRRTELAIENGFVNESLLRAIETSPPKLKNSTGTIVSRISDVELSTLKTDYNPRSLMSLENIHSSSTPLSEQNQADVDSLVHNINNTMRSAGWKHNLRKWGLRATAMASLIFAVGITAVSLNSNYEKEKAENYQETRKIDAQNNFQSYFIREFSSLMKDSINKKSTNLLRLDSQYLSDLEEKYSLPPNLLWNIGKANRIFADLDVHNSYELIDLPNINIFDVFERRDCIPDSCYDGMRNAESAARRISRYLYASENNLMDAMVKFYEPIQHDWLYKIDEEKFVDVRKNIITLAYTSIKGEISVKDLPGVYRELLREVPKDIMDKYLNEKRVKKLSIAHLNSIGTINKY